MNEHERRDQLPFRRRGLAFHHTADRTGSGRPLRGETTMRKLLVLASAIAMAAPAVSLTFTPVEALASAADCRAAATVGGGVGGALIGGGLAHGGTAGAL